MAKVEKPAEDFGQGIFNMDFIVTVGKMADIVAAKKLAYEKIDDSKGVTDENKRKAKTMIAKATTIRNHNPQPQSATTIRNLIFGMTNFSMSHQGMKVLK